MVGYLVPLNAIKWLLSTKKLIVIEVHCKVIKLVNKNLMENIS